MLELQPHRRDRLHLTERTLLERDLGLDSLGRMELFVRLGRELDVDIPDGALATVESLGDLAAAIDAAGAGRGRARLDSAGRRRGLERVAALPLGRVDADGDARLARPRASGPSARLLHRRRGRRESTLTYAGLREAACARSRRGWGARDLTPGQAVAIMLPTCPEFFVVFFGILMAGGRSRADLSAGPPVPDRGSPETAGGHPAQRRGARPRHGRGGQTRRPLPPRAGRVAAPRRDAVGDLGLGGRLARAFRRAPRTWPFSSTPPAARGEPKGVALTHANLLANIRGDGDGPEGGNRRTCSSAGCRFITTWG